MIDSDSPLAGWLKDGRAPDGAEIVVVLSGVDESSGQTIYGRMAYTHRDIRWNARFVDILDLDEEGRRTIDYARFHDLEDMPG